MPPFDEILTGLGLLVVVVVGILTVLIVRQEKRMKRIPTTNVQRMLGRALDHAKWVDEHGHNAPELIEGTLEVAINDCEHAHAELTRSLIEFREKPTGLGPAPV